MKQSISITLQLYTLYAGDTVDYMTHIQVYNCHMDVMGKSGFLRFSIIYR